MNLKVKLDDQVYDVEVGNPHERPIQVLVNGQSFEVWPEMAITQAVTPKPATTASEKSNEGAGKLPASETSVVAHSGSTTPSSVASMMAVRAPIPGVITSIAVHAGSEVTVGQELCKLEAMKMNNSIRANHTGIINAIHVSIGQHVKHNDTLMDFVE